MPPLIPQDPSQIQRHRPNTDDFVKNSREEDLWDLADISDAADASEQAAPLPIQPRRSMPSIPPLPSDKGESPPVDADKSGMPVLPVAITPRFQSRQSVNVARLGRVSPVRLSADSSAPESGAAVGDATPENLFEDAFDNLDDWDDALQIPVPISADNRLAAPEAEPTPPHPHTDQDRSVPSTDQDRSIPPTAEDRSVPSSAQDRSVPPTAEDRSVPSAAQDRSVPPTAEDRSVPSAAQDRSVAPTAESAPNPTEEEPGTAIKEIARSTEPIVKPLSLRPHLGLSKLEAVSLITLALLLLVGGYWVYDHSVNRLLGQAGQLAKVTFPVHGTHITVNSVATYWRKPLKDGNRIDAVRRGVVLIPVAEISVQGAPGAIRALVLNENGLAVGDPITRPVDGTTTLTLSATDGFEDISLHAAYRTGQTQPWTLRIFEASSANAQGKEFKKLLELPISPDKH